MRKLCLMAFIWVAAFTNLAMSQGVNIEGYVYEDGNRGYLNLAKVTFLDRTTQSKILETVTNMDGVFQVDVPAGVDYLVRVEKDLFAPVKQELSTIGKTSGEKIFMKVKMLRKPGYVFEVTIAEKSEEGEVADAVQGARIEVYNNTTEKEVMALDNHPSPVFKTHFEDGNHYTLLIRKKGYFNKRLEAFVNVKGCILCFEGVGNVKPSDVLTEGHSMGTLLANVELQKIEIGKGIKVENIYYDYNKFNIREDAAMELDKLIAVLKNNPAMIVELGSHTDSRGKDEYNLSLSEKRAKSAVDYVVQVGQIESYKIKAKGYGETKILNRCKNGVTCRESQHEANRRTELTIVGFLSNDPFANRSLADIIEEEKYEKLLEEIGNGEVLRVPADGELPDELQAQMDKMEEEAAKADSNSRVNAVDSVIEEEGNTNSNSNANVVVAPSVTTTSPNSGRRPFKPNLETEPDPDDFKTNTETFEESLTADLGQESSKIVSDVPIDNSSSLRRDKTLRIPANYTGYRIEFFAASFELAASHQIFANHGNIVQEQKKDGTYAYLMGDFDDWRDANKFLTNILLERYPDARVVRYKKGRRLAN